MKTSKTISAAARPRRPESRGYSFKLPWAVVSRLETLLELYPQRPRAQVVAELVLLGITEHERRSSVPLAGADIQPDMTQPVYLPTGPFAEFRRLNYRHHLATEYRLAKEDRGLQNPGGENALGEAE